MGRDGMGCLSPWGNFLLLISFLELKYIFIICKILWQGISKLNPMVGSGKFSGSVFYVPPIVSAVVWGVRT